MVVRRARQVDVAITVAINSVKRVVVVVRRRKIVEHVALIVGLVRG